MDQIYIPKNRTNLPTGSYVIIKPITTQTISNKPYFYNLPHIEPIKLQIIEQIIKAINKTTENDNIIVTGSFLDKGFNFNDIDILLITKEKPNTQTKTLKENIEKIIGIKVHIISLNNKELIQGLSTDPLYQMMLSKYVSKKRFIYRVNQKINPKILDLHLLKSKTLIDNFDILNGNEKYYLTRNLIAISQFLKNKKINQKDVDKNIKTLFNINTKEIKQNLIEKKLFLKKYKKLYNQTFNKIMGHIKNASKQK